ncbi:hypothetical protein F444_23120 [Phytophthora nicotianae P1976]|uniref:DDE Tnp4 domain-containing protein n=1 Tax=Phytophthora nicotianae P1976 TaxID=1317066 RepID=A0A080YVU4_PHYNI|nr:hypothetical protein F444_23120 [Phytophthora nicotianae P1976]
MKVESFEILQSFIRTALVRDELQSRRRTGTDPISPENMLQMTIAWLAGSGHQVSRCLGGTNQQGPLDALDALTDGCARFAKEVPDETSFFSGHYQRYGVNVQAICDSLSRFIGCCFDSTGKWETRENTDAVVLLRILEDVQFTRRAL